MMSNSFGTIISLIFRLVVGGFIVCEPAIILNLKFICEDKGFPVLNPTGEILTAIISFVLAFLIGALIGKIISKIKSSFTKTQEPIQ